MLTVVTSNVNGVRAATRNGGLAQLREAVRSFGFHFAIMDLRQNSAVHERVVAELLREAAVAADYKSLPEAERIALLVRELESPRLLRSPYRTYSEETAKEIAIVDTAAELRRKFGEDAVLLMVIQYSRSLKGFRDLVASDDRFAPKGEPVGGALLVKDEAEQAAKREARKARKAAKKK